MGAPSDPKIRKIKLLLIAALLLFGLRCDPMTVELQRLDRVEVQNNLVIIHVDRRYTMGIGGPNPEPDFALLSTDGGETWQRMNNMPPAWTALGDASTVNPHRVCSQAMPKICYRITGGPWIEESLDGGDRWHIAWGYPADRRYFLERAWSPKDDTLPLDLNPLDLAILDTVDGPELFVAMGFQGLLIRNVSGDWIQQPIKLAKPIPAQVRSIDQLILIIPGEISFFSVFGAALMLFYCLRSLILQITLSSRRVRTLRIISILITLALITGVYWVKVAFRTSDYVWFWERRLLTIYHLFENIQRVHGIWWYVFAITIVILASAFSLKARKVIRSITILPTYVGYTGVFLIFSIGPLFLWCYGIIPAYTSALILSISLMTVWILIPRDRLLQLPYEAEDVHRSAIHIKNKPTEK